MSDSLGNYRRATLPSRIAEVKQREDFIGPTGHLELNSSRPW